MHQAVMGLLSQPERSFAISRNAICSVWNFDLPE
jgi:hypothetical protein